MSLEMSEPMALSSIFKSALACLGVYLLLLVSTHILWWKKQSRDEEKSLKLYYKKGSRYMEQVIEKCSTLHEGFHPATLWGRSGHLQSLIVGTIGRTSISKVEGQRFSVKAADNSTLYYDVFEPQKPMAWRKKGEDDSDIFPYTFFVSPGINGSSETNYVKGFVAYYTGAGFRTVVVNHLGALKSEKLTGHRIFTYGGTEDMANVFEDVCNRYPNTKLIGCGLSLGAFILVRFLGEKKSRREKFVCAISSSQGYDSYMHRNYIEEWANMRNIYSRAIVYEEKKIILQHRDALFPKNVDISHENKSEFQELPLEYFCGFKTEITHEGHNSIGCSLDRKKCSMADQKKVFSSSVMTELDDAFQRRILGFDSSEDMYRWLSCVKLLDEINDLPILLVNSLDDPCVMKKSHSFPQNHAEKHSKSLFVQTLHGGHLGFYEGGLMPNSSWLERLIVEFSKACIETSDS